MKKIITLLLMITIQITFIQKVTASVLLIESDTQSMIHCEMEHMQTSSEDCATQMVTMENCQVDCEMMTVVSVIHFIENEQILSFMYTDINYPNFIASAANSLPKSLYRPPLFS